MRTIIRGGRVLDPASSTDGIRDILVEDGIIKEVAEHISTDAENVIEAEGLYVMPGLIDLHVHFREPGFEHKETIRTGARAAARGGFTTVCVMPNTKPVVDSVEMVKYVIDKAKEVTDIHVLPIAAITAGQDGEFITDFENLYKNGAVAVSEDGTAAFTAEQNPSGFLTAALRFGKFHRQLTGKVGTGAQDVLGFSESKEHIIARSRELCRKPCFEICCRQCAAPILNPETDLLQNGYCALFEDFTDFAHCMGKLFCVNYCTTHAARLLVFFSSTVCIRIVWVEKSVCKALFSPWVRML